MKAKREQTDGEQMVIKLFGSNYARDLMIKDLPIFFILLN
jgi:hypothetical protein